MIPIKLTLRNFMCYRDNVPTINFESIHTACISGNNGHGKSALIDALTWALWGQSRASSDDDLIHAGQNEVEVEFEFAAGTQRYRILRRHSRPKSQKSSGQTILEFQLATPEGFKVLSGDTTTQTQQKIIQLLHMDYETFVNSAFLRQGHADEFTKKRPADRKQVLGNILQLSAYDQLEELAKTRTREQSETIVQLETSLSSIREELIHKPFYEAEFARAQTELTESEKLMGDLEARLQNLRQNKQSLETKKIQLADLTTHIQEREMDCQRWKDQTRQCQLHIKTYEDLIARRDSILKDFNRLADARKLSQDLDQKFKQVNSLIQNKHRLEMAVVRAGEELTKAHAVVENRIHELESIEQRLPRLNEEMKGILGQLRSLEEIETGLQEKRESSKLLQARVHFMQAEKTRLVQEIEQVGEKLKLLTHPDGVTCPLCDTELGPEGQKRIEIKYEAEKSAKGEALRSNQSELAMKEEESRILETEIGQTESRIKHAKEIAHARYGTLSQAILDAQQAGDKVLAEKESLAQIEQHLAGRDFAANEQAALGEIDKQILSIGYDPQQHELIRTQLTTFEQFEGPKRQLEEADRLITQERDAEAKACRTATELESKLNDDRQRILALSSELNAFIQIAGDLTRAEMDYQTTLANQKRIQEVIGRAKANLDRLTELEGRCQEKETQLSQAGKQEKIFKDLALAFGKKGIQAMLIEMAIPEIESEANKLLSRMTDNRMHVKMETQRETKKGDVLETLDINISDELGTRSYEMFSGGEAFRIDFAIRIALSKLLARRAGAPLPTLIIDEGFGTQDNTGIEKIKEAITSIQDDFEKILVITHISDFKDAFPMRIEVAKTPEGSTIFLN
jgi:DNA repair protein SbcC/Rad50